MTTLLIWPDEIACHGTDALIAQYPAFWRPAEDEPSLQQPTAQENAIWVQPWPDGVYSSPYGQPYRTCSYCGSIHPGDLYALLSLPGGQPCRRCGAGDRDIARHFPHTCRVSLGGSDWKYGWPHKFYVNGIPNPIAGKLAISSSTSRWDKERGGTILEWGAPSPAPQFTHAKFYNAHLKDCQGGAFRMLVQVIAERTGIEFHRELDGRLKYRAPFHGYQP